ncbi:MAG TPA: hypothetical protein PKW52_13360 [Nitrospira sp.]|nr:hypothetical protein [Nitrospira sp.]HQV12329.1 hypothetical protein [Nitrospira sp.]
MKITTISILGNFFVILAAFVMSGALPDFVYPGDPLGTLSEVSVQSPQLSKPSGASNNAQSITTASQNSQAVAVPSADIAQKLNPQADVKTGGARPTADWEVDVLMPVVRLAAVLGILLIFLLMLKLPEVLRRQAWTEKTVLAFSVVFTFCTAALMGANESAQFVKELALVVIGFYFGSSKDKQGDATQRHERGLNQDQKSGEQKHHG